MKHRAAEITTKCDLSDENTSKSEAKQEDVIRELHHLRYLIKQTRAENQQLRAENRQLRERADKSHDALIRLSHMTPVQICASDGVYRMCKKTPDNWSM